MMLRSIRIPIAPATMKANGTAISSE
jgi:hypothetical protein